MGYLVHGMTSLNLDNCFNPSRYAFYTLLTLFHRKIPPLQHYITIKGHFVIITEKGSVLLA